MYTDVICMCYVYGHVMYMLIVYGYVGGERREEDGTGGGGGRDAFKTRTHTSESGGKNPTIFHTQKISFSKRSGDFWSRLVGN